MCGSVDLRGSTGGSGPQDGWSSVPLPPTAQYDEEGTAKRLVEEGVEDGVQHGVDVAQPEAGCPQLVGHCVVYKRVHHVGHKEWCPAEAEAPHNDAQCLGRLCLCSHAVVPLMVGRVCGRGARSGTGTGTRDDGCVGSRSSCSLQHADLQGVGSGCDVDPLVGQHHQDQWDVEGHQRTGEGVWLIDHEDTGRGVAAFTVASLLDLVRNNEIRHQSSRSCDSGMSRSRQHIFKW